jgi:hypothetical protein
VEEIQIDKVELAHGEQKVGQIDFVVELFDLKQITVWILKLGQVTGRMTTFIANEEASVSMKQIETLLQSHELLDRRISKF